jgi:hypothetical protein
VLSRECRAAMLQRARSSCKINRRETISLDPSCRDGEREWKTNLDLNSEDLVGHIGGRTRDPVVEHLHLVRSELPAHRRESLRLLSLAREVILRSLLDGFEIALARDGLEGALHASADRRKTRDIFSCISTSFRRRSSGLARVGLGEGGGDVVLDGGRVVKGSEGGLELVLDVDEHGVSLEFDPDDGLLHLGHLGLGVGLCSLGLDEFCSKQERERQAGAKSEALASFAGSSLGQRSGKRTYSVKGSPSPFLARSGRWTADGSSSCPFQSWLEGRSCSNDTRR